MRGCATRSKPSTVRTGSAMIASIGSFSLTIRFTNDVLEPFSSSRRTRYGSRSSCSPTGAYTRHGTPSPLGSVTWVYSSSPMPCRRWNSMNPALLRACSDGRRPCARCAWRTADTGACPASNTWRAHARYETSVLRLACEHRVSRQAPLLAALDLGVPVRALDQAHVQDAPPSLSRPDRSAASRGCAPLVCLHRDARSRSTRRAGSRQHGREQFERQFEPLGLLGVERQRDARVAREPAQFDEPRREFAMHALTVGALEARMHRRELHRDARRRFEIRVLVDARR